VFSGIVAATAVARALTRLGGGARLELACELGGEPLRPGESVAVDGACLTVASLTPGGFLADLSSETVKRTTLSRLRPGQRVNIERALKVGERIGGHLVQGHIDSTARVLAAQPAGEFVTLRVALPSGVAPEVAEKGSIAVDGVSLTVAAVGDGWFEAALVPATLDGTTLGSRRPGDEVNLETDVLAKYVRRALGEDRGGRSPWEGMGRAED
jgi:riboflavin synthase